MDIHSIESTWKDHYDFAIWLVNYLKPKVTVDLGVYHGFSTFAFATPGYGIVYAIDNFSIKNSYKTFMMNLLDLELTNVWIYGVDFDNAVDSWDEKIDILHIDGDHSYEQVRNDFDKWSKYVTGCILLHDVLNSCFDGPIRVFKEELANYHGIVLEPSQGLGVLTKDDNLLKAIMDQRGLKKIKTIDYEKKNNGVLVKLVEEK